MREPLTAIRFTPAPDADRRLGLAGWIQFQLGGLVVDGVTLRATADGGHALSFPTRRDRKGCDHPILRPLDQAARARIEAEILTALHDQLEPL